MTTAVLSDRETNSVCVVTRDDIPLLAGMLARAFTHDPVFIWGIPDPARRPARSKSAFEAILELYVAKGHVYADARLRSAALWAPPGSNRIQPLHIVRMLPPLADAYRHRLPLMLAGLARVERQHPDGAFWYLGYLGTDPDHQGHGPRIEGARTCARAV